MNGYAQIAIYARSLVVVSPSFGPAVTHVGEGKACTVVPFAIKGPALERSATVTTAGGVHGFLAVLRSFIGRTACCEVAGL